MEKKTSTRKATVITDNDFTLCCCWMCDHCVYDLGRGYICKIDNHTIGGNADAHIDRSDCDFFKRNR